MAKTATECKLPNCHEPRYVYPGGALAPLCAEHIHLRQQTSRDGLPSMTYLMRGVMEQLDAAHEPDIGHYFIALDVPGTVSRRTIRTLIKRDWIIESHGLDGIRYKITGRGAEALHVYQEPPRRRLDGICPHCNERPRVGNLGYCLECHRDIQNEYYRTNGRTIDPDTAIPICPRCKKRPRHVYPSGHIIAYCSHCRKVLRRKERRRKHKRRLALILNGTPPICLVPGCTEPVHHSGRTTYDYCQHHYQEQQARCRIRRNYERVFGPAHPQKEPV